MHRAIRQAARLDPRLRAVHGTVDVLRHNETPPRWRIWNEWRFFDGLRIGGVELGPLRLASPLYWLLTAPGPQRPLTVYVSGGELVGLRVGGVTYYRRELRTRASSLAFHIVLIACLQWIPDAKVTPALRMALSVPSLVLLAWDLWRWLWLRSLWQAVDAKGV